MTLESLMKDLCLLTYADYLFNFEFYTLLEKTGYEFSVKQWANNLKINVI